MRVKLTHEAAPGLLNMIEYLLKSFPVDHNNAGELLLDILVRKVRNKLRAKVEGDIRAEYSLTFAKEEALAFELWVFQMSALIPPKAYIYEQNTATQIINLLNKLRTKQLNPHNKLINQTYA